METAILAVVMVASVSIVTWYLRREMRSLRDELSLIRFNASGHYELTKNVFEGLEAIERVLTKASQIKAAKPADSVFDRDTIAPMAPRRYVSLAVRRAQAEAASLGPVTHEDKVRANNTRAIESAG